MADSYKGRGVAFLVLLLFVMGPYMTLVPPAPALLLDETQKPNFVTEGTPVTVDVRPGQISQSPFMLDVPSSTGAITSLDLAVQSATMANSQTLLWEGDASWNHVDARTTTHLLNLVSYPETGRFQATILTTDSKVGLSLHRRMLGHTPAMLAVTTDRVEDPSRPKQARRLSMPRRQPLT